MPDATARPNGRPPRLVPVEDGEPGGVHPDACPAPVRPSRRRFLAASTASAGFTAAFVISGTKASGRVLGANDRIRVAVAGVHGRGAAHIDGYAELSNVVVSALVDPDARVFPSRIEQVRSRFGGATPTCLQDLRRVLEGDQVDVVSIASTNHWHALLSIWACQAGKDVYVEKPCSHNVFEGRKLVEAARKYGRIVQHGTQNRSSPQWAAMTAAARSGTYGRLLVAYGYASKPRRSIGFKEPIQPPPELNFDLWLGPAPQQPYHENIVHYNWHWFWDFGNGEIGNQGVHQMDIARWGLPAGAVPKSVVSLGGRFGGEDQGQTPNTQLSIIDFGGPKIIFEDRGLVGTKPVAGTGASEPPKVTNEFLCEGGWLRDGRFFPDDAQDRVGEPLPAIEPPRPGGPFGNFIEAVRSRDRSMLNAEILEGHRSSLLCHIANISYRVGEDAPLSAIPAAIGSDPRGIEAFESMRDHLTAFAGLDPARDRIRVGRLLVWDDARETFSDPEADRLLSRDYRAPYAVPETV
jgi:predicted dehydrogenase